MAYRKCAACGGTGTVERVVGMVYSRGDVEFTADVPIESECMCELDMCTCGPCIQEYEEQSARKFEHLREEELSRQEEEDQDD